MVNPDRQKKIDEARESLERIQGFDVQTLVRKDLGTLNFSEGVPHAERLIELFSQVALEVLDGLPEVELGKIKNQSDAIYSRFQTALKLTLDGQNPKSVHDGFITQVESDYDPLWTQLQQSISYSVRRQMNFGALEREARGHMQAVRDTSDKLESDLEQSKKDANSILEEIRKVAAEQGVQQQAIYFKQEADQHVADAATWLTRTSLATVGLGAYAIIALFIHKIPVLAPANQLEAAQLIVGKVLLFATIASFVVLAARNYLAHRHNAVVNRHRQNALVTYTALVEAAGDAGNKEVVLTAAAECIFSPQSSGFGSSEKGDGSSFSMVKVAGGMKSLQ